MTIAEAYFGLGRHQKDYYEQARSWLKRAARLPNVPGWERESTARQLAAIAQLQAVTARDFTPLEQTPAWEVLQDFLGKNYAKGLRGIFLGKIGLALSGGGFRASLFHIGVLARLAELDMLRHVEVLSCVSGGSIVGAHYYLEIRHLLQTKEDADITREDYLKIVQKVQDDFLAGVQQNIRMRVLADFTANLRMIFAPHSYSRTQRAGELYEEEIYKRVADSNGTNPRYMDELLIRPAKDSDNFAPKHDNWRRAAKVPMLILNATTLNTGHNWQFTATWMGEPPAAIETEIDSNDRLRRMYYEEAPAEYRQIRLDHAVAASACVPGIFDSPLRAFSIAQARVREAQFQELDARRRASLLRGLMFVHLKKDLPSASVNWVECEDPQEANEGVSFAESPGGLTSYGIRKDIQEQLAVIRTDLNSFTVRLP